MNSEAAVVVTADPELAKQVERLLGARAIFFAGLPGTGKSLLLHQVAHLLAARARHIHLLQWDVARPVFEATAAGGRYPMVDGVTHGVIRKAAGIWARRAVAVWERAHPGVEHVLLGETPLVGNRFMELVRPAEDPAERWLRAPSYRFAVPVPSHAVRAFLEAERARRARHPLHEREREDAPPQVLRALWQDLVDVAHALGLGTAGRALISASTEPGVQAAGPESVDSGPPWDPALYRAVYESVLRHRHVDVLPLQKVLPTTELSVYRFAIASLDLVPAPAEAEDAIVEVERTYPESDLLQEEIARWWHV